MKLDRNINKDGTGKYALLKMRKLREVRIELSPGTLEWHELEDALETLEFHDIVDFGSGAGTPGDFFVIRLKDKYASAALGAYARAADQDDPEYAAEVRALAAAARVHGTRKPD